MKLYKIPFNKPTLTGNELEFIRDSVNSGKISGDGVFSRKCQEFFERRYGFSKTLMTTSCTDALELSALLLGIQKGDEIIVPSFTFVSTANPFLLRGATIRFCDSSGENPNIDVGEIESLITKKTKAIVVVHYAGIAVDLDPIIAICQKYGLFLVEDAAQAIDSTYKGKPLGGFGEVSTFSFHETKNVNCGEGGLLVINRADFQKTAEILREKGTNRSAFFRGEINKYGWVSLGSSFLPSDILAAFLYAQIERLDEIQQARKSIWQIYYNRMTILMQKGFLKVQLIPAYASNNAHMFYILCSSLEQRTELVEFLKANDVYAAFHYQSLHASQFFKDLHDGRNLPHADYYSNHLLRLPIFFGMKTAEANFVCDKIEEFFTKR